MSYSEKTNSDDSQRIVLEKSQETIENAGDAKEKLAKETEVKDQYLLETALTTATDYDVATIVSVVLSGTSIAVEVGATLPIIGLAISLIDRIIKQYQAYKELNDLFETVKESILNCALMITLAKETIAIFKKKLTEFFSDASLREDFKTTITKVQQYKLNSSIEIKIETSLKKIIDILTKFDNTSKSNFQKFKDFLSKSFQGNFYISFLKNEISMLLLHITTYNMQFVWVLFLNEHHLQKISRTMNGKVINLSDELWNAIEDTESFKNYLINDVSPQKLKDLADGVKKGGGRRRKQRKSRGKKKTTRHNWQRLMLRKTRKKLLYAAYKDLK
jgi:hypothetical protein